MWGWGAYSDPFPILAATKPLAIISIYGSIAPLTGDFKVSWTLADD
jgi:hypothetical protein